MGRVWEATADLYKNCCYDHPLLPAPVRQEGLDQQSQLLCSSFSSPIELVDSDPQQGQAVGTRLLPAASIRLRGSSPSLPSFLLSTASPCLLEIIAV